MAFCSSTASVALLLLVTHLCLGDNRLAADSSSPNDHCPRNKFGISCKSSCHCKDSQLCDTVTGVCPGSACDRYMGPNCQQKRIFPKMKGYQKIIDQNLDNKNASQCTYIKDSMLRIWLGNVKVKRIVIYTLRSELEQFRHFQIHASNKKTISNSTLLYEHRDTISPSGKVSIDFATKINGKRIFIVLPGNNRRLTLCEVLIGGDCSDGWFSSDCSRECHCKKPSKCNSDTGNCVGGCIAGWRGNNCYTECSKGFYGPGCLQTCNQCHLYKCNRFNGTCFLGCKAGYRGLKCKEECSKGFYGPGCLQTCNQCHLYKCNRFNGTCFLGCKAGYRGLKCKEECPAGSYGRNCSKTCSLKCHDRLCNRFNGSCIHGCKPGYTGPMCQHDCPDGKYGVGCKEACPSRCLDGICNHINGFCINGCHPGYIGKQCNEACYRHTYGEGCNDNCSRTCLEQLCHHAHGNCTKGCMPGYKGHHCQTTCYRHTYGEGCNDNCSRTCLEQLCHHAHGNCTKGCMPGYKGHHCQTKCDKHSYGLHCSKTCSSNCLSQICNHINGRCRSGCVDGFQGRHCNSTCSNNKYGFRCLKSCSRFCIDRECDHITGKCTKFCKPGYQGEKCDSLCQQQFYGSGCMIQCSQHCVNGICNPINGFCFQGCEPGFWKPLCLIECPHTYYGQNCRKECNHNCFNQTCHHVNGTCLEECILGYSGSHCSKIVQSGKQFQLDMFYILTGALVANIMVLILCVMCCRYFRSPKTQPPKLLAEQAFAMGTIEHAEESDHLMSDQTNGGLRLTDGSTADICGEDEIIYMNVGENDIIIPDSIPVSELQLYIQNKRNFEGGFGAEYRRLSPNSEATCKAANQPENKAKNRYKNIVAYDHSRVIMEKDKDGDSDYINANYIDGYNKPKKYIASQGPTSAIITDFWQMLWQVNCTKLVMLTNLIETGKTKCEKYWPDKELKSYGELKIRCVREQNFSDYTIRSFFIQRADLPLRKLDQFHFTSWSDHGVPPTPTGLVNFMTKINVDSDPENGPLVVHCSAGIGRSGTFIALDYLMDEAQNTGTVDVFGCVNRMRKDRLNMVQIEDQYEFIYLALVESIFLQNTHITIEDFPSYYQNMIEEKDENDSSKTLVQQQFQELQELEYPYTSPEFLETAKMKNNLNKTRVKNILASDLHRPYLKPAPDGQPRYINAVYLPSHENSRSYVATQMPMKDTIEDFWQMVCDIQGTTIVMLNSDDSMDETCCKYWKDDGEAEFGHIIVHSSKVEDRTDFMERTLLIQNKETGKQLSVKQYQYISWPAGSTVPTDTVSFLHMIEEIKQHLQQTQLQHKAPMVVHCLNGAERSGLFCVVFSLLLLLQKERTVNIPYIVRTMQLPRPQLLTSLEQFQFCHIAVMEYIDRFQAYGNL